MLYVLKSSDVSNNNVINLKQKINGEFVFHSFTFNNEIYNVTSNNNILPYYESSLTNIELTKQYVNGDDLASDIQTKINAISGGTAAVTYSSATGKFTITNTTAFSLKFGDNTNNTCNNLLGFNQTNTTSATSVTSDNIAYLSPYQRIMIKISGDNITSISDQDYGDYSFIITTNANFGDIAQYISKENDIREQRIYVNNVKHVKITFYDENGNLLSLNNWCLVLFQ